MDYGLISHASCQQVVFKRAHAALLGGRPIAVAEPVEQAMDDVPAKLFQVGETMPRGVGTGHTGGDEDFPDDRCPVIAKAQHVRRAIVTEEPPVQATHPLRPDERDGQRPPRANPQQPHRAAGESPEACHVDRHVALGISHAHRWDTRRGTWDR